tara:strand:- start:203 stop:451 length:249 start_codon:yes stop_codon:yes gene_type:complete
MSTAQACFLSGEQTSGMNKICFYDCVSGTKSITIGATDLCPLSISYKKYENGSKSPSLQEAKSICPQKEDEISYRLCKKQKS